jgi:elongation factor G
MPIGLSENHEGVVDLVKRVAYTFKGVKGEEVEETEVPSSLSDEVEERRNTLIEAVADVDDSLAELYLEGDEIDASTLTEAIGRATKAREFVPVFMGSAFKNKGVQPLLDGVVSYLPAPTAREGVHALDLENDEAPVPIECDSDAPLLALAFKLEESRFGQLTYVRIYQGTLKKGDYIQNVRTRSRTKVPRVVRMHADDMEEIDAASAGDVVAIFGVECASMDSFVSGEKRGEASRLAMASMYVPRPVISLAVAPKKGAPPNVVDAFGNALQRFTREDPTLRVHVDNESKQTIISGMGELHLDVYVERMRREYKVEVDVGEPQVNYREAITRKATFDYLHKKQTGGSGQYAKIIGYIEPTEEDDFEFVNECVGTNVPSEFIPSVEKGCRDAIAKGDLVGFPVEGLRVVLQDGAAHAVDSSDQAFRAAALYAVKKAIGEAGAKVLEPVMALEVSAPTEFQGDIMGSINQRRGMITNNSTDGAQSVINADVPLAQLFGYSTDIRSQTQGKGEFTMEYKTHTSVMPDQQAELVKEFQQRRAEESK